MAFLFRIPNKTVEVPALAGGLNLLRRTPFLKQPQLSRFRQRRPEVVERQFRRRLVQAEFLAEDLEGPLDLLGDLAAAAHPLAEFGLIQSPVARGLNQSENAILLGRLRSFEPIEKDRFD